jgi:hypothetical protein
MPTVMLTVGIAVALGAELAGAAADLTSAATDLAGARSLSVVDSFPVKPFNCSLYELVGFL